MENWPRLDLNSMKEYNLCFGCGKQNPIGLKLDFSWDGATATARFKPGQYLQGWSGYLHGGITACVLDEAMGRTAMFAGYHNVTAKLQVRYRKMAPVDDTYTVTCTVSRKTSRLIETEARLIASDGSVVAEATSTQFIVNLVKDN